MKLRIATLAVISSSALLASPAAAKRGAPACDAGFLPFYEGEVLEYEWLAPEALAIDGEEPAVARGPQADWPINFKVVVKSVKSSKKSATITLVETYRKRSVETEITCDEKGFNISPQSFFFAGEPGGGIGMTLSKFKQDVPGLPSARDFRPGIDWTSYITAEVARVATPGLEDPSITNGKIEIDRSIAIRGKELVQTGLTEYRAFRVDIELSGRAAVEPSMDKWRELPPGRVVMWYAPEVGLVRVHNHFGHGWQIKNITYAGE